MAEKAEAGRATALRVVHVLPSLSPRWGGPVSVVKYLTGSLARLGVHNMVIASVGARVGTDPVQLEAADVRLIPTSLPARLWPAYGRAWGRELSRAVSDADLVHIHELWHYPHFAAYRAAAVARRPYVVTTHGGLDPRHLAHKRWKKRLYLALFQRRILHGAQGIHAMTAEEAEQVRGFVPEGLVRVIPNGAEVPRTDEMPSRSEFETRCPAVRGKLVILFLGRLARVKGLGLLADAFEQVARRHANAFLLVVGPDDDGYGAEIQALIRRAGWSNRALFTGMLTGREKLAALAASDVFVLPSYSEGFSMAILEAMGCGLPVVISDNCKFPQVAQQDAGVIVPANAEALAGALSRLAGSADERLRMGRNGRRLIEAEYTWDRIGLQMLRFYREALERIVPDNVSPQVVRR